MQSIPTPSHQTSPHTDPGGDIPESISSLSEIFLTPSRTDQVDTSQDSMEDDNVSTVSEISGLSELSGQDWKPMAGSMMWVSNMLLCKHKHPTCQPVKIFTRIKGGVE